MVNNISDYIPPFSPLPNIAPFTYKDGETYLSELDNLRVFVNDTLVTFVNENFALINDSTTTEINVLIAEVNTALTGAGANIATIQTIHDQVVALVASLPDLTTTLAAINGGVAASAASADAAATSENISATNATNSANSATDASVAASNASSASTAAINAQKGQNFGIPGLDGSAKLLEVNIPTRLVDANLKTEFADKTIETIVTTGRLSDISLQNEFILISGNKLFKSFSTYANMVATAGVNNDLAIVGNINGAYFQHDGISWKMIGIAKFVDIATFNTISFVPTNGSRRKISTNSFVEEYFDGNIVPIPGWYPVIGKMPFTRLTISGNIATATPTSVGVGTTNLAPTALVSNVSPNSDILNWHSNTFNTDRITPTIAGKYHVNVEIEFGSNATGYRYAQLMKNGVRIPGYIQEQNTVANQYGGSMLTGDIWLNGTTDYLTLTISQASSTTLAISGQFYVGFAGVE